MKEMTLKDLAYRDLLNSRSICLSQEAKVLELRRQLEIAEKNLSRLEAQRDRLEEKYMNLK
jgi:DNA-binding Xre family transcriptional regulator